MNRQGFCSDDERELKQDRMIKINVGGEMISTRRDVLTRVSNSKLAKMINGDCESIPALDADGNIFLDYQPELFRHLLGQLRLMKPNQSHPMISLPPITTTGLTIQTDDRRVELSFGTGGQERDHHFERWRRNLRHTSGNLDASVHVSIGHDCFFVQFVRHGCQRTHLSRSRSQIISFSSRATTHDLVLQADLCPSTPIGR